MLRVKGKALTPEEKSYIVTLKNYFDRNKTEFGSTDTSVQMVSDALEVGLGTVNRVMSSYNKDPTSIYEMPQPKGRPTHSIGASAQEIVRAYIRAANLEGLHITLETIRDYLKEHSLNDTDDFHIATLARTLDRWGFEFGKGTRTQNLKEKDYVVAARHRYLRNMRNNRLKGSKETIRPEIYLDETYVNKNHSNDFIWYSTEDGPWIQKPTGKGERLIIINAISKDGWVPNAKLVFKSTRKTGDYHGQMNGELFQKWFSEKLIPNLPKNSNIILDNASYHNVLTESSAPIRQSSKARIYDWLDQNKIPCHLDCLKPELIEILAKIAPEPTYVIDEIARENGHKVIRTPPYHPELQPIEICWGVLKNEVARNCNFTMENLELQLQNAFKKVTSETCSKIIKQIRAVEDKFWEDDTKLDGMEDRGESD
jgi:transposase